MSPVKLGASGKRQQLRIIGGKWRGRKLAFPAVEGLRPTGDRIRETLFNWLAPEIVGARCLDLFAGSGALGLEALSRGADNLTLVEAAEPAARQLRQHLQTLGADNAEVIQGDSLQLIWPADTQWDLVFIDPPFEENLWQPVMDWLTAQVLLAPEAAIYVESPPTGAYRVPAHWQLHREKITGQVSYRLYHYRPGGN